MRILAETRGLSLRLDEEGKDEVARLGAAFNQMLAALERSLTAQRQLVADASHEFRTPLTSIRANAELLARGSASDGEAETIASQVVEQVDELDGLVGDVIELALDGEAETRLEDVRLDEIVTDQVERMRRYAAGVRFDVASGPSTVRGDPERLQRAVANVLANAVKWSPPDGVVDVGVARGVVTVRDHGPGNRRGRPPLRLRALLPRGRGPRHAGLGARPRDRASRRRGLRRHGGGVERPRRRRRRHAAPARERLRAAVAALDARSGAPTSCSRRPRSRARRRRSGSGAAWPARASRRGPRARRFGSRP
jgi:hypothetical protein